MRILVKMTSPIHKHFCQLVGGVQESEKSQMLCAKNHNNNNNCNCNKNGHHPIEKAEGSAGRLLPYLQPEPFAAAMISFQMVAGVVQSVLHQCKASQKPKCETPLQFNTSMEPSFCYFVVDMQPQTDNDYNYPDYGLKSCSDLSPNISDSDCFPIDLQLHRQRSISEGSDDSFICFKEEDNDDDDDDDNDEDDDEDSCPTFACTTDEKLDDGVKELRKKVHFNLSPEVHVMHAWNFAYRAARKGGWQQFARDRDRFSQRIKRVAPIIDIVLSPSHRDRVYRDRFLDVN
ncbi:GH20179 [Drosophila grimshawi]|uniref:GH20179 n=2 Tax=Drosophila grimshawi TaxID=7222 RepID=B4J663_DROGR|nr:GH20179 [Drosophila grimshawi]